MGVGIAVGVLIASFIIAFNRPKNVGTALLHILLLTIAAVAAGILGPVVLEAMKGE